MEDQLLKEARGLIQDLDAIKEDGYELDEYQRGVYDTLSWLLYGSEIPEIEDE